MAASDHIEDNRQAGHILPHWLIIGFSGHRKLANEQTLRNGLRQAFEHPAMHDRRLATVSSAACGADTVFLEEMKARSIPQFVILPFDRDSFRKDFSDAQWMRVEPFIATAIDCEILSGDLERNEAFLEAGILTVDRSDLLVVCWNGQPASGKGGTSEIVAYARAVMKPLIIIDETTGNLTCERIDDLPSVIRQPSDKEKDRLEPLQLVIAEQKQLAGAAKKHGPQSRNLVLRLINLHLSASAIAIIGLLFISPDTDALWGYIVAFFKLFALSWALVLVRKHHHVHSQWIGSRLGAELCRCYIAIWKLRRNFSIIPNTEGMNLNDLARSLRMLWYLDKAQAVDLDTARAIYREQRIEDQRSYFQSSLNRTAPWYLWGRRAALAGTIGAIAAIIISLLIPHDDHDEFIYKSMKAASLLLPLLSAAILSVLVARDMGRRSIRYRDMVEILDLSHKRLERVQTWPGMWRLVADTERELLREVTEWHAVTRFGGESH